jgi:hypothetical protein
MTDGQTPTIAVLLGAGASADAGIPTTIRMTEAVIQRVRDSTASTEYVRILEFVRVERLFASVEMLMDRAAQPWSPFVATLGSRQRVPAGYSPTYRSGESAERCQ